MHPLIRSNRFRIALAIAILLDAVPAFAERDALWDVKIEDRRAWLTAAAVSGKTAFVSGSEVLAKDPLLEQRGIVAALDTADGSVRWVHEGPTGVGKKEPVAGLSRIALAKGLVVAAGGFIDDEGIRSEIRVLDSRSGELLWSREIPGGSIDSHLAVAGNAAFLATTIDTRIEQGIALRAYDLRTGAVLWDDFYTRDTARVEANAVVASGRNVAVVGRLGGETGWDSLVRVHDARTGDFRWADLYDFEEHDDAASVAAISGRRLYVGGTQIPENGDVDELVSAFDLRDGAVLWRKSEDTEGNQLVDALAADAGGAYAMTRTGLAYHVRAFEAKTGTERWAKPVEPETEWASRSLAVKGRRVVASVPEGAVAFDARTGAVAWDAVRGGVGAAAGGRSVYVVGFDGAVAYSVK
jgi:outer membrane protein assembly factor BamB